MLLTEHLCYNDRATRELVIARHVLFNNLLQFLRKPSALALASHRAVLQVDGFHALRCDMNIKQYQELASMVEMAEENQGTLRFGAHYALKAYLKKNFNLITGDNRDTIKRARRLLDEFMTAYTSEE
jgi:hypothetical protein